MDYKTALHFAQMINQQLSPNCERIEIAGSIRRKKQTGIKDVEIVCIPKQVMQNSTLFGDPFPLRDPDFVRVCQQWELVKGNPKTGKFCQFLTYPLSNGDEDFPISRRG